MGVYDTLPNGQQVKCWGIEMLNVNYGDIVPEVGGLTTYSIALREGGYANVKDNIFKSITTSPASKDIFDKWGEPFTEDTKGIMEENYTF